jgi:hypothetical protein
MDVRDTRGRLIHMAIAAPIGIVGSLGITLLLPTRDHFPQPPGSCGFGHWDQGWLVTGGSPSLVILGAFCIAFGVYVILRARRTRRG